MQGELGPTVGRARNIVRGVGSLTVYSALNAVLSFVQFTVLVRLLPRTVYGAYSSAQVSATIASVVAGVGLASAVVRYLAPSSGATGSGWGPAKAAMYLTLAFAGAASLVFALAAPYLSDYFLKSPADAWVFYLGALWTFTAAVDNPILAMLQGMRKYHRYSAVLLGSKVVSVAVAIAGVVLYQSLAIAIAAQALFAALSTMAALPTVFGPFRRASARGSYLKVLRYGFPLGVAGIVSIIAANADIVVVGGYLNLGDLAVYNATVTISTVLAAFFVTPLVTALFAESSFSSETIAEVSRGVYLALRFALLTVLPASLFAAAVSPQLFNLFSSGGGYAEGIPFLELITVFYLFFAVQTVSIYVLQGVGRTRQVLLTGLVTAVGEVGLSVSLVPGLGLAGAAISRVTVFALGCTVSLYFLRPYLKGALGVGFLAKALVSAGVPGVVVFALSSVVSDRILTLLPYTVVGLLLFLGCARALKLFSAEDRSFVAHLLPARLQWVIRFI